MATAAPPEGAGPQPAVVISRRVIVLLTSGPAPLLSEVQDILEQDRIHNEESFERAARMQADVQDEIGRLRSQLDAALTALNGMRAKCTGIEGDLARTEARAAACDALRAKTELQGRRLKVLNAKTAEQEKLLHGAADQLEALCAERDTWLEGESRLEAMRASHAKREVAIRAELRECQGDLAIAQGQLLAQASAALGSSAAESQGGNGGSLECTDPPAPLKGNGPEARAGDAELEDVVKVYPDTSTTPSTPATPSGNHVPAGAAAAKPEGFEDIKAATGRKTASMPDSLVSDGFNTVCNVVIGHEPNIQMSTVNEADVNSHESADPEVTHGVAERMIASMPECHTMYVHDSDCNLASEDVPDIRTSTAEAVAMEEDMGRLQAEHLEMQAVSRMMRRHGMTPAVMRKLRKLGFKV